MPEVSCATSRTSAALGAGIARLDCADACAVAAACCAASGTAARTLQQLPPRCRRSRCRAGRRIGRINRPHRFRRSDVQHLSLLQPRGRLEAIPRLQLPDTAMMMLRDARQRVATLDAIHQWRRLLKRRALVSASLTAGLRVHRKPALQPLPAHRTQPTRPTAAPVCAPCCPTFAQPLTASATHTPARLAIIVLSKRFPIMFDSCFFIGRPGAALSRAMRAF